MNYAIMFVIKKCDDKNLVTENHREKQRATENMVEIYLCVTFLFSVALYDLNL